MTELADLRDKLAETLRACGPAALKLRATPYITESIDPPHALFDFEIDPHVTFDPGPDLYRFTVTVFCNRSEPQASQKYLDELRNPRNADSVPARVEADSAPLGDLDDFQYARVTSVSRVDVRTVGTVEFLTVDFEIEVVA